MPLRQYFSCVGSVLLAMLFILDAYFPKPPAIEKARADLPAIRIHSDRKWPERVVYDTSLPTTVPAPIFSAEVKTPQAIGGARPSTSAGDAFAMLTMPAVQLPRSNAKMREPKPRHQNKIVRKRAPAAPRFAMARQMQFGWFGGNFW